MISRVRIRNFRNHKDTTLLASDRFTVIAGANGVGKSNVVAALLELRESLVSGDSREAIDLEFTVINSEGSERDYSLYKHSACETVGQGDLPIDKHWCYLKLDSNQLVLPSYSEVIDPQLLPSGKYLATVIANMMTSDFARFESLKACFQEVVPHVVDIRATREKVTVVRGKTAEIDGRQLSYQEPDEMIGDSLLFDTKTDKGLSASAMNEGAMMALALLTAVFQNPQPTVLLIDDFESGLFGESQFNLALLYRKLLKQFTDLQIILTTRSAYVLNAAEPHQVNILHTDENGNSIAKLLSEHPKAGDAMETISTGDLWLLDWPAWMTTENL